MRYMPLRMISRQWQSPRRGGMCIIPRHLILYLFICVCNIC